MKKYDLIILIISSNNDIYNEMKTFSRIYMDLYKNKIKYFFIEFDPNLENDITENSNTLYFKGTESIIPGIYQKTMKALEYINTHYEYDFVMRTNPI